MGTAVIVYASGPSSNTNVAVTIRGGNLTLSNSTNQVSLNVSKKVNLINYSLPIMVTDARGSGSGWNLTITSTTFVTSNSKDKLPTNASQIIGVTLGCSANFTCTKPVNSISYPLGVPAGDKAPPPMKFFNAAVNSGLGGFNLTTMVQVNIPANAKPGTYTSTVILSVVAGP